MDRHRDQAAREPGEIAQKTLQILRGQHADDEHQRTRHPLLHIGDRRRDHARALGIVRAVEPNLAAFRRERRQATGGQPLQPGRPIYLEETGLERGGVDPGIAEAPQGRNRRAGIVELMASEQPRPRQIEQPVLILVDQPPVLLRHQPMLARHHQLRAEPRRLALDHAACLVDLRGDHRRHPRLENAGLLGRDLHDAVAEILDVIERDRSDHGRDRALDDVGRIEPAAKPDFHQQHVGRMPGEQQQPGGRGDLEHRDRRAGVDALAFAERVRELLVGNQHAAARTSEPKAFVDAHEIGRGVDMHVASPRFQHRAQEGDGRALAVGAADVNDRRQTPLRVTEPLQKPHHAIERQVDPLGVKRKQPGNDGVDRGHELVFRGALAHAGAGAGSAAASVGAGVLVSTRHNRASVGRSR